LFVFSLSIVALRFAVAEVQKKSGKVTSLKARKNLRICGDLPDNENFNQTPIRVGVMLSALF